MRNVSVTYAIDDPTFAALADPIRRAIVLRLASGPASVGELTRPFAVSRPAISRHLRLLREAGIVHSERRGRRHIYRLEPTGLVGAETFFADVRTAWNAALAAFKEYVEHRS